MGSPTQLHDLRCPSCHRLLLRQDVQGRIEVKCRRCGSIVSYQREMTGCRDCPALAGIVELLSERK